MDQFLRHAEAAIGQITAAGKPVVAVGGTALYIKALLYGIFDGPPADFAIRKRLKAQMDAESTRALHARLAEVDPEAASRVHPNDARRIIRALEVYELTGKPISSFRRSSGRIRCGTTGRSSGCGGRSRGRTRESTEGPSG